MLAEDEKRFYQIDLTRKGNYSLNQIAKNVLEFLKRNKNFKKNNIQTEKKPIKLIII